MLPNSIWISNTEMPISLKVLVEDAFMPKFLEYLTGNIK